MKTKKFNGTSANTAYLVQKFCTIIKPKFINDIKKSTTPNDWIIARTNKEETYGKIAKMIREYGKFFEKESKKHGFKVLNMDDDFDNQINEAIKYLTTA